MTFLELCQAVRATCGVTTAGPSTVVNQSDMLAKIVGWVREADYEIQCKFNDWNFLWTESNGTGPIDLPGCNIRRIDVAGTQLRKADYQQLRVLTDAPAQPRQYAIKPNGSIVLHPTPDVDYPFYVEYYKAPERLTSDAQHSAIPLCYRMIIVHRALMMFATSEEDPNLYGRSEYQYELLLRQMSNTHRPKLVVLS